MGRTAIVGAVLALAAGAATLTAPEAATDLEVWTIPWDSEAHAAFAEIIKGDQAQHPDMTVTDESRGIDEHTTAMRVAAGSG